MEHAGFQHQALIYEGADQYLGGTLPFLRTALEAGEPALVAVREERAKLLKAALGAEADRVRFLPIEEVGRNPARVSVLWRDFVEASGGRPGRGIGESVWTGRSRAALDECHRHEALLNLVFASSQPWSLLCPYDAQALPDEELEIAARTHRLISREGRTEESAAFEVDPDSLSGELPRPTVRPDTLSFGIAELSEVRRRRPRPPSRPARTRARSPTWSPRSASSPPTASCTGAAPGRCASGAKGEACWPRSRTRGGSRSSWSGGCGRTSARRVAAGSGSRISSATWSRSAPASAARWSAFTSPRGIAPRVPRRLPRLLILAATPSARTPEVRPGGRVPGCPSG
jgi:hypothetical protein